MADETAAADATSTAEATSTPDATSTADTVDTTPGEIAAQPAGGPLRVVIAGGGIAGLATAWYLLQAAAATGRAIDVTLYEREGRVGGKIVTDRADGFVIEGGPDSFLTAKPWAIDLCRDLGLGDRLIPTNPNQRSTYVYSRGQLHAIPDGLRLIAPTRIWPFVRSPLVSWPGKLRMALDLVLPPRRESGDESIGSFVRRRLGPEALARLGEPLMAGIFVGDPDRLSLQATFPQFAALEHTHGGVIRGLRAAAASPGGPSTGSSVGSAPGSPAGGPRPMFMSLAGGTQELVEALEAALGPSVIRTGRGLAAIERRVGGYRIRLDDGTTIDADVVVLATPAPVAARLIETTLPDLARQIAAIRHLSTATVSLGFRRADVAHPLDGTGFVVTRDAPLRIVACTWSSTKYAGRAPADAVLLRAFIGGAGREGDVDLGDADLVDLVRRDLRTVLGITAEPVIARIFRWRHANPQYDVGHLDRIRAIEAACPPGLHLAGGAYRDVGVPGCIRQAREVADVVLTKD